MKKLTMIVAVAFFTLAVNAQEAPKPAAAPAPAKKEAAPAKKTDAKKTETKKTETKKTETKTTTPAPAAK